MQLQGLVECRSDGDQLEHCLLDLEFLRQVCGINSKLELVDE